MYGERLGCSGITNLDVVALVVVATFPKQAMMHDIVNIQLVEQRISVLVIGVRTKAPTSSRESPTLDTEAVNTTTS